MNEPVAPIDLESDLLADELHLRQVEALLRALPKLTPDQFEVIVLRYYCEFSVSVTSLCTETTERAVLARQRRAIDRLREVLARQGVTKASDILR